MNIERKTFRNDSSKSPPEPRAFAMSSGRQGLVKRPSQIVPTRNARSGPPSSGGTQPGTQEVTVKFDAQPKELDHEAEAGMKTRACMILGRWMPSSQFSIGHLVMLVLADSSSASAYRNAQGVACSLPRGRSNSGQRQFWKRPLEGAEGLQSL